MNTVLALFLARWIGMAILSIALAFVMVAAVIMPSRQRFAGEMARALTDFFNPPRHKRSRPSRRRNPN